MAKAVKPYKNDPGQEERALEWDITGRFLNAAVLAYSTSPLLTSPYLVVERTILSNPRAAKH